MNHPTVLAVVQRIKEIYPRSAPQIESAFRKYVLSHLGFPATGNRVTKVEMAKIEALMAERLLPMYTRLEWEKLIDQSLKASGLSQEAQRFPRSYLKKLVDCLEQLDYLLKTEIVSSQPVDPVFLKRRQLDLIADKSYLEQSKPKQRQQPKILLSLKATDYLKDYQKFHSTLSESEILQMIETELERIQEEVKELSHYVTHHDDFRLRATTLKTNTIRLYHLLGYQYSLTKNLADVGIYQLIPVVNTNVFYSDFSDLNAYYLAKGQLIDQANIQADKTIKFIRSFFNSYASNYKQGSKGVYISTLVLCAKYVYRDITDITQHSNYEDIPVVKKLRLLKTKLPKDNEKIEILPLNWDEVYQMLMELKKRADDTFYYRKPIGKGKIRQEKRKMRLVAVDMQRFLALCFLVIVPPIRCLSLSILELGTTLKHGFWDEAGFKPKELLSDPSQARFYYHFQGDQYKTGKFYGEFIAELPNYFFEDGSCFYDYLKKWFYEGYLNSLLVNGQQHQFMFVRVGANGHSAKEKGDPMEEHIFSNLVSLITKKYFNIKVRPHLFRKIYRTHLINIGATPKQLASAAFFMQHSEKMAQRVYTVQTVQEKVSPILDFLNDRLRT